MKAAFINNCESDAAIALLYLYEVTNVNAETNVKTEARSEQQYALVKMPFSKIFTPKTKFVKICAKRNIQKQIQPTADTVLSSLQSELK